MNTTLTPADLDPRRQAMLLYFQGYRVARIAEMLGEKVATVHSWKKRDKWGDYGPLDQMQLTTAARYCQLIMKSTKKGKISKRLTCWRASLSATRGSASLTMAATKPT